MERLAVRSFPPQSLAPGRRRGCPRRWGTAWWYLRGGLDRSRYPVLREGHGTGGGAAGAGARGLGPWQHLERLALSAPGEPIVRFGAPWRRHARARCAPGQLSPARSARALLRRVTRPRGQSTRDVSRTAGPAHTRRPFAGSGRLCSRYGRGLSPGTRRARGAVTVELAAAIPLLAAVTVALAAVVVIARDQVLVQGAAREGARAAAVSGDRSQAVTAARAALPRGSEATVQVTRVSAERVQVRVRLPVHLPPASPVTLTASAVAAVEPSVPPTLGRSP